jgi:hypothetical protein
MQGQKHAKQDNKQLGGFDCHRVDDDRVFYHPRCHGPPPNIIQSGMAVFACHARGSVGPRASSRHCRYEVRGPGGPVLCVLRHWAVLVVCLVWSAPGNLSNVDVTVPLNETQLMTPLFASLGFGDYAVIAFIVMVFAGSASLGHQVILRRVERKLDALLQHHGIELPSKLSPEVQQLAGDPNNKAAAVMLHQTEYPDLSQAEAKAEVERFAETKQ